MSGNIIEVRDLVKEFGGFRAVDGLSIDVGEGEVFGLLGPNGAGKTTTIRMMTTLLRPDSGTIVLGGHDISREPQAAKRLIGMSQQHISLDKDISLRENIRHKAMLLGLPSALAKERIDELVHTMKLEPYMDKLTSDLSGGCKRRGAIVCAVLHEPRILFLDEPTAGLDTQTRHILWEMIGMLRDKGTTVVLTTHYIEEAEALSDRIAVVDAGRIIIEGTPAGLCEGLGKWTVEYIDDDDCRRYRYFGTRPEATAFAGSQGTPDRSLVRLTRLEDVYLEATGRQDLREAE